MDMDAPLMTTLPWLSKLVGAIFTEPAFALKTPPVALVNPVMFIVNEVPLAAITPLLTNVAALELPMFNAPVDASVTPLPIVHVPVAPTAARIVPPVRLIVAVSVSGLATPKVWLP